MTLRLQNNLKSWTDPATGREVRQLTDLPGGAQVDYFRLPRLLPDGQILARAKHDGGNLILIDLEGNCTPLNLGNIQPVKLRVSDGRLWYQLSGHTEIWCIDLPGGEPKRLCAVPHNLIGVLADVTCDGRTLIAAEAHVAADAAPIPTTHDLDAFWRFFDRPRSSTLWAIDLNTGQQRAFLQTKNICVIHVECSPIDPGLVRYAHDMYDAFGQRVWTVRTDGSDRRPIRTQIYGELVTHEFWWADPNLIGYTYQDRRGDETLNRLPWAEYSPRPTQLGIADLAGNEVYLSDPLNHYHTHLFVSPDGNWVCGEGTDGHFGIFAARFDRRTTKLDMLHLASINTPYIPFRGQQIDAGFSHDSRWVLYNNTIDGILQVCAVAV